MPAYLLGQMVGAIIGAVLAWVAYKLQFDTHDEPANTRGIFCTGPTVPNYAWNVVTEIIGTFVLVFWILLTDPVDGVPTSARSATRRSSFVVIGIGASLGGPTGYAINPARDLGPRIAYALLPIKGKGSAEWNYSWVPVVGPLVGGDPRRRCSSSCSRPHPEFSERLRSMTSYVAAIDQGTTSTRCMIFSHAGEVVSVDQKEHEQIFPQAGWVEHDPEEVWRNTREVAAGRARQGRPVHLATSSPSASPTSARPRWCGTRTPASRSTTRSSGRTPAPTGSAPSSEALGGGQDRYKAEDRPAARDLLLRAEDPLDPRQRRRRAAAGRGR